jgi:hypothetical protein
MRSEPARGFTLLAVSLMGLIVAAAAAALVIVAREGSRATIDDDKNAAAWAAAMAGLTWAQLHLDDNAGKAALQSAAAGTPSVAAGLTIHPFDPDDPFAGVGTAPPAKGTSNATWKAFENGHFALLGASDALSSTSVLVRAVGRVGTSQVVLETNLQVNVLKALPGAFTGCFGGDTQITYFDEESPYDYYGNMRFDGNGGVPIGMSADHNRLNGLARYTETGSTPPPDIGADDPIANYPFGKRWRGTQSLRSEPLAGAIPGVAGAVSTRVGGVPATNMHSDDIGPAAGWEGNPYIANDPRLAWLHNPLDTGDKTAGLGLGHGGMVDGRQANVTSTKFANVQRGMPIIGYIGTPNNISHVQGGFLGEEDWAPFSKDDRARKGFYGCDNHGGANGDLAAAARVCLTGSNSTTSDWSAKGLYHSGRAWGFLSSVLRHCTGSGDAINPVTGDPWFDATNNPNGIKCSGAFEYLENIAACTIMPPNVARGTNVNRPAGDGVLVNDFRGCHPGCLLAADIDDDGAADTPYRSVCVNLDATVVTAYGPDIQTAMAPGTWDLPEAPLTAHPSVAYVANWHAYAASRRPADVAAPPAVPATDVAVDAAGDLIKLPGFVVERGNTSLITRFDLTDRGPLGTCEQNCLGYGFGRDRTYGAHRTEPGLGGAVGTAAEPDHCSAKVPIEPSGFTEVHCNLDYDRDGRLDRKSYAIASSYREECADPHDGISWGPCFNISSSNSSIGGAGCVNRMPNDAPAAPPIVLTPFCDQGALSEIQASVDNLLTGATTVTTASLAAKNTLTDGANWFGGAKCHLGASVTNYVGRADPGVHPHGGNLAGVGNNDLDAFGHPDYWIEDECPDPRVIKVSGGTLNVGHICGCGVLVLDDVKLVFGNGGHLLWRGLVVWRMNTITGDVWNATGAGFASFVVEGGFLATGNQDFKIVITKQDLDSTVVDNDENRANKQQFRMNPTAIQEALAGQQSALRSVRRIQ